MPKYGTQYSSTDGLKKADGRSMDAAARYFSNEFDLAVDGGTTQGLKICDLPAGVVPREVIIESDAGLSALTFTAGSAALPAKYLAPTSGPAITTRFTSGTVPIAMRLDATTVQEEIFLTPSAAIPATGRLRVTLVATKR